MRLIEELARIICADSSNRGDCENCGFYESRSCDKFKTAERIINADYVPVVRCKDCKHWHEETGYCDNHSYFIGIDGMSCSPAESPSWTTWDENDFCSDGDRKDGDCNG